MTRFHCGCLAFILATLIASLAVAQEEAANSAEDKQFQAIADRYWKILERRPRRDTAFDLWYRHYLDAGKLQELAKQVEERAAAKPADYAAQMLLGLVEERRGNDDQALAAFRAAEQVAPENYYPPYLRATLLIRGQQPNEAITALTKALKLKPPRTELLEIYKRLGRLQLQQQNTAEALKTLAEMAETFPDDRQVLEELAQLLADERQYDEALKRWEQLAALAADDPYQQLQARVEIAQLKIALGKRSEAVTLLEAALDQAKPDSWLERDIRRRIEQAFLQGNDVSALADWCQQRLEKKPQDLATMVQLADALRQSSHASEALLHYQRAVELAPTRRDLREALIDALVSADRLAGAIAQCQLLAEQQPDDPDILKRLGELHIEAAGDEELAEAERKAIRIWRRIAAGKDKDARSAVLVAETCRQAGQQQKYRRLDSPSNQDEETASPLTAVAEEHYRLAVERAPNEPQYREYLGEFLHAQKRPAEAIEAWKALAHTPQESAESWHRLAEVYAGFNYLAEAVAASEQAVKLKPDDFALHDFRLGLLIKHEKHEAALAEASELDRLADTQAARERSLTRRVEIYSAAGQVDEAIARLEKEVTGKKATLHDRWLLALLLADQWKFGEAARQYEAALSEAGDDVALLEAYADALKRSGDLAGAVAQYQRLVKADPRSRFATYQEIIQLELQRNNPAAARDAADQLVKLAPASLEGYRVRAAVAFRLKDDEEGFRDLRQAVKIAPRDVDIRSQLARALAERGQRDEALEHYWRSFELSDELSDKLPLVSAMASAASLPTQKDELIEKLRRLRARQDDPKMLTLCLNEALVRMKRYSDAERELVALLDQEGDDPDLLRQLASIAERQRQWPAAVRYQQRLVALDDNRSHLETLARFLSEQGDADASARIWQRLLEEAKDDTVAAAVVDRQLQQGRVRDALALARLHLEKDPQSWRLLLRAALAHLMLAERDEAGKHYAALLALEEPPVATPATSPSTASAGSPGAATAVPSATGQTLPPPTGPVASGLPRTASAAYALSTVSALHRPPAFGATFAETQEIQEVQRILPRLVSAEQAGTRRESATRRIVAGRPAQPGRPAAPVPAPASSAQRAAVAAASARQASFTPSFASDFASAQLEATAALYYLAFRGGTAEAWLSGEIDVGKSDPRRLRRAASVSGILATAQQELRARLLAMLIEARPDDPLPHLIRLYISAGTVRAAQAEAILVGNKQQHVAELAESYAWLVRRQPEAAKDLSYYYVLRLNALDEAAQAADIIEAQLAAASDFEDLGALPNLIIASNNESLVRKLLTRSAELAAEPNVPSSAAPYLTVVLEHALASNKYTSEADIAQLLLLLDRYLLLDESRLASSTGPPLTTVTTSSGQVVVVQTATGQVVSVRAPATSSSRVAATRQQALLSQLKLYEAQLAQLRSAPNASAAQLEAMTKRYELIVGQLRQMGVEPAGFPERNSYLDGQQFNMLERFAKALKRNERHGMLLERLAKGADSHTGQDRLRYQVAAAFSLWWTDEPASALAMLEKLHRDNEHDQVLAVSLAQAYYNGKQLREALAIVERIKNPDPSVAQPLERLRQEIRRRYSDLARLRDLKGHTHVVRSVAFSPDGRQLLSGSYDRSLRIWEVESGQFVKNFAGHTDLVLCAAWSPAGDRIASGSYDEIRIWDVASAACLTTIKSPGGAVRSLAFSPDGKIIASAGDDRAVRLCAVDDGSELATLEGHTERVFCVAFSPDGKLLASAGGDRTVRLWNVDSRQLLDTLTGHSASISCVAFAPDGQSLASGSDDNNVMLWRLPAGKAYATLQRHTDSVFSVSFSPDGRLLASGGADRSVKLWKLTSSGDEPATLLGHSNTVSSVAFSPDGKTLASGGYDELVKLWTLLTPAEKHKD